MFSLLRSFIFLASTLCAFIFGSHPLYAADEPSTKFMDAVCALRSETGNITFGGSEGCTWHYSGADGVTDETEEINFSASRFLSSEEIDALFIQWKGIFDETITSSEGYAKMEPLPICDGGFKMSAVNDPVHPPSTSGFFKCGSHFVMLFTRGKRFDPEFDTLAPKIVPLLAIKD